MILTANMQFSYCLVSVLLGIVSSFCNTRLIKDVPYCMDLLREQFKTDCPGKLHSIKNEYLEVEPWFVRGVKVHILLALPMLDVGNYGMTFLRIY